MWLQSLIFMLPLAILQIQWQTQEKKVHPRQLRAVLRVAQCISLCASLVMLAYGGVSIHYLLKINFAQPVFAMFGELGIECRQYDG